MEVRSLSSLFFFFFKFGFCVCMGKKEDMFKKEKKIGLSYYNLENVNRTHNILKDRKEGGEKQPELWLCHNYDVK